MELLEFINRVFVASFWFHVIFAVLSFIVILLDERQEMSLVRPANTYFILGAIASFLGVVATNLLCP